MKAQVVDGATVTTLATYSNVGTNATYTQKSSTLTAHTGRTVTIRFTMTEDSSLQTAFVVDDTSSRRADLHRPGWMPSLTTAGTASTPFRTETRIRRAPEHPLKHH